MLQNVGTFDVPDLWHGGHCQAHECDFSNTWPWQELTVGRPHVYGIFMYTQWVQIVNYHHMFLWSAMEKTICMCHLLWLLCFRFLLVEECLTFWNHPEVMSIEARYSSVVTIWTNLLQWFCPFLVTQWFWRHFWYRSFFKFLEDLCANSQESSKPN